MGLMTVAMVLLTLAGIAGGVVVAGTDPALAAVLLGWLLAGGMVAVAGEAIDLSLRPTGRGTAIALAAALIPPAAAVGFAALAAQHVASAGWPGGLALYLTATGPWTLLAAAAPRRHRTVRGIRAFAAHLGVWLLVVARAGLGLGWPASVTVAALSVILPAGVAFLLSRADPAVIRAVRV